MTGQEVAPAEQQIGREICSVSVEAARTIVRPLLTELGDPASVLYTVMNARMAGVPEEARPGIAPSLLVDPTNSGVERKLARYEIQSGALPPDVDNSDPNRMLALWSATREDIPKLSVPKGRETALMEVASRLQMFGGGPLIFAREEADRVPYQERTILNVVGGANNANRERLKTALAYLEVHGNPNQPILATVDPRRRLKAPELGKVADLGFAPEARNELELLVDSAVAEGFIASNGNRYGVRFLPDGSSYLRMRHTNGAELIVLAPAAHQRLNGEDQSGVYNAYHALDKIGTELFGDNFQFEGNHVIHVNSTHYGTMGTLNNLRAIYDLRTAISSFHIIGDNQPAARDAQAHLIEIGKTLNAVGESFDASQALKSALLQETDS